MDETLNRVLKLLKLSKVSKGKFLSDLGLNKSTISDWTSGKSSSYIKHASKIAKYFDVTTDYLLGNEQKNKPDTISDGLGPKGKAILERLNKIEALSKEDFDFAVAQLDLIINRREIQDKK